MKENSNLKALINAAKDFGIDVENMNKTIVPDIELASFHFEVENFSNVWHTEKPSREAALYSLSECERLFLVNQKIPVNELVAALPVISSYYVLREFFESADIGRHNHSREYYESLQWIYVRLVELAKTYRQSGEYFIMIDCRYPAYESLLEKQFQLAKTPVDVFVVGKLGAIFYYSCLRDCRRQPEGHIDIDRYFYIVSDFGDNTHVIKWNTRVMHKILDLSENFDDTRFARVFVIYEVRGIRDNGPHIIPAMYKQCFELFERTLLLASNTNEICEVMGDFPIRESEKKQILIDCINKRRP